MGSNRMNTPKEREAICKVTRSRPLHMYSYGKKVLVMEGKASPNNIKRRHHL